MATQTGSIDLFASNSVHLFAETGFTNAEQTYATKSELSVTNDAVALRATKTEASQMAQPNLAPLFSMDHSSVYDATTNPDGYWRLTKLAGYGFTQLDDGWTHFEYDNTDGTDQRYRYIRPARVPSIVPGNPYTILLEIRNNAPTGTGTHDIYLQQISNNQFWGNVSDEVIDADHVTTTTQVNLASCGASFVRRSYRLADTAHLTDESGWLFTYTIRTAVGCTNSLDLRMSVYEGIYDGPYKPYSGNVLYATQSELKVTADGISTEVSKKVNGTEIISAINQSAETVQIAASKVEIDGTAVFTAISSKVDDAITDKGYQTSSQVEDAITGKGYATTTQAQGYASTAKSEAISAAAADATTKASAAETNAKKYTDNLEIGGRNLLRDTQYMTSWGKNNGTTIVDGVVTFPTVTANKWREIYPGRNFKYDLIRNKQITFSCEANVPSDQTSVLNFCIGLDTTETANARQKYRNQSVTVTGTGTWQKVSVTADVTDAWFTSGSGTVDYDDCWVTVRPGAWSSSWAGFQVRLFKLELGNKATDWSPAPEDQTAYVDAAEENVLNRITSRGEQLVTNGNGFLGDNTNFPQLIFDGFESNLSPGSFTKNPSPAADISSYEMFPVDTSKQYLCEFDVKCEDPGAQLYAMLRFYDADKNLIGVRHVSFYPSSTTTLARELKNGDTVIYLTSAAGWHNTTATHQRSVIIWDYTNSFGYTYPPETYSRNYYSDIYASDSSVNKTNNTITLKTAWAGGTHAAGTSISQNCSGGGYGYFWYITSIANFPREWTHASGLYTGIAVPTDSNPVASNIRPLGFWSGTAYCRMGFLWNYRTTAQASQEQGRIWVTNISVKENKASATNAVSRTQRIYYRSNSSTPPNTPGTASSNWVTKADDGNAAWTKMHVAISSTHKYIYTCEQYEMADGIIGYTSVLLDNTITVIDGGNIITGSVTANKLDADSVKANIVQTTDLSADKITSGDISADRIKTNVISAINSLTAGTIDAARINATELTIGQSQVSGLGNALNAKANSSDVYTKTQTDSAINAIEIGSRNLVLDTSFDMPDAYTKTADGSHVVRRYELSEYASSSIKNGSKVTVTFEGKVSAGSFPMQVYIGYYDGTTATTIINGGSPTPTFTTEWTKLSRTLDYSSNLVPTWVQVTATTSTGSSGKTYSIRGMKLELGNKATDWTPAPEDVADDISTKLDESGNRIWYAECSTVAATTAKVATITPTTTSFTLVKGQTVNVWFSATNTGAVGDITLNVNNTGAKGIKYLANGLVGNLPAANYLRANQIVTFTYDGNYWVTDFSFYDSSGITNARYRTQYANAIKAATAITAAHIICGTSAGYKNIAANVEFNLDYPLLYATAAITAASTGTSNYLTYNAVNVANNGTVEGVATNKMVYLKGTVTGNTFKIAASDFLTCTVPSSAGFVYIPLGIAYNTTPNIYFSSNKDLYAYVDGAFGPVSIREASAAAKTATNYISLHPTDGIKIANANPATATTYQHLTATSTEFVVEGASMLEMDGTNGARVGKEDGINTCVGSGGFYIRNSNDVRAGFEYEAASGSTPGNTTIESSDGLKLYGNVSSIDGTETGKTYVLLSGIRYNRDSEKASVAIVANSDPDNSSGDGNGSHIASIHLDGGNTSGDSIPSGEPSVSIHVGGESFDIGKPTSLYSTGSVSVANSSWVSVANLTIPSTGTWMVVVTGDFAANATGRRVVACTRNAAPSSTPSYDSQNSLAMAPANGSVTKFNSSAIIDFDADDVYYAGVWQNSGSALTTRIMIKAVRLI